MFFKFILNIFILCMLFINCNCQSDNRIPPDELCRINADGGEVMQAADHICHVHCLVRSTDLQQQMNTLMINYEDGTPCELGPGRSSTCQNRICLEL